MPQIILTFPDRATEDLFLRMAREQGIDARWVAVNPNLEYDHEWQFTDDMIWDSLAPSIAEIINEEFHGGQPVWPRNPFSSWLPFQRRMLIEMAVTRWGYLGPNGAIREDLVRHHRQVMHVGRGDAEARDQSKPTQTQMHSETIEGLPGHVIPTESGFSPEPLTAISPGEPADWQGETVHDGKNWGMLDGIQEHLPDPLLDPADVGGLTHESGAADLRREATAWQEQRNRDMVRVDWRFTTADARIKLKSLYPSVQSS